MSEYKWADGFHAPKGVKADVVMAAIERLPSPTPEALLEASKAKRHPLHGWLWSEGDQAWAQRARLSACRKILGAVEEIVVIGGKSIEVRAVEFVKGDAKSGAWMTMQDIMADKEALSAYLRDVVRAQESATAKVERVRRLLEG